MKKEYTYCILSLLIFVIGVIFTISGVVLQSLPLSSKSALLIFSFGFILIGVVLFAVHYKRYQLMKKLIKHNLSVVARWTYPPNSSETLKKFISEQKCNSIATALLVLILAVIFCIVFAYSGGSYILWLGYSFALLSICIFIIALRFIFAYYNNLSHSECKVLFGEDCIYFIDEIYTLTYGLHNLEEISIFLGTENLLIFEYGSYDIDSSSYRLVIPIPPNKLSIAMHIKDYYRSIIHSTDF